jgi:hypothetical protein
LSFSSFNSIINFDLGKFILNITFLLMCIFIMPKIIKIAFSKLLTRNKLNKLFHICQDKFFRSIYLIKNDVKYT